MPERVEDLVYGLAVVESDDGGHGGHWGVVVEDWGKGVGVRRRGGF